MVMLLEPAEGSLGAMSEAGVLVPPKLLEADCGIEHLGLSRSIGSHSAKDTIAVGGTIIDGRHGERVRSN